MTITGVAEQSNGSGFSPAAQESVVGKYHAPRIAVIIPHFNYSEFIADALLSVQQQTYGNFTCIVVDDCSTGDHFKVVSQEVAKLSDDRFKLVKTKENAGAVAAVYRGMEEIDAAFMAILDPDDRYAPQFLEKMLAVHLNPLIYCPLACCDQQLLKIGDGVITGTQYDNGLSALLSNVVESEQATYSKFGFHKYVPPIEDGWHWSSTSSMMFRTDALRLLRPIRKLPYKGQIDDYYANGAHMLGGTLLLREALVYRGLHDRNDFISNTIFSMFQKRARSGSVSMQRAAKIDVFEAFLENGGLEFFDLENVQDVVRAQFQGEELSRLLAAVPQVAKLVGPGKAKGSRKERRPRAKGKPPVNRKLR